MSNKPKKLKNVILQVGNFVITKDSGEHDWVCIKATSGFWTLRYRDDHAMYGRILEMVRNKEAHDLLRYFINMCFMMASTLPDGPFVKGFFDAYQDYVNRMVERKGIPTEKEEDEAIEEMKTLHELQSELTDLTAAANEQEQAQDVENTVHAEQGGD
ncbi:MAG: hypothetical protein NC548_36170 [Lachnospiraceae bacterium]|nr:hypothetical protein [Lachnospiraceae bacterium]